MVRDAGFVVSDRCAIRPKSFDLAARRGDDLVLLKILGNVDAFDAAAGAEMRRLGSYLDATPLVIGLRTRDEELKPEVVYFRHGVSVVSPDTAYDLFVEEVPPLIYAAPGGLYINIDGDVLADERERRGWSLGRLAVELGVSRRTVSKYEDGMNASVEVAMAIEDLFDADIASTVRVFEGAEAVRESEPTPDDPELDPGDRTIVAALTRAGFDVHPTGRTPFDAVSEDAGREPPLLTGHSEFTDTARRRAEFMASLAGVAHTRSVYFVDRARSESIDGTAIIERDEAEDADEDELRDLIRGRSEEAT